jgi:hypothetical protein
MLTVKMRHASGHEEVVEARRVSLQPAKADIPETLFIEDPDGHIGHRIEGTYFVMNESGSTVARYFLSHVEDQPTHPLRVIMMDGGSEVYSYDQTKNSNCLCPGADERSIVLDALAEAVRFIKPDPKTQALVDRINQATAELRAT